MVSKCEEKVPYLCERTATNAAYLINLRHRNDPKWRLTTPYKCPACPDWHLTSNPTMPDGLPLRSSARSAASTSTSASGKRSRRGIGWRPRPALATSSLRAVSSVAGGMTNAAAISFEWAGSIGTSTRPAT